MAEYEEAAHISLAKMNQHHQKQILDLRKRIISDYPIIGKPVNKKIIDMKNKEKALTRSKQYDAAERMRKKRELLEEIDMQNFVKQDIKRLLEKEETKLRNKQEIALLALIKRIQRDRNEQLLHRKIDSKRIIQRNKNLIQHIQKNQEMELKKTKDYLLFSLGTRAPGGKTSNFKSRSQSTKKKKIKRINAIDMSNDEKEKESFFITDRGNLSRHKTKGNRSLNKSRLEKSSRSTSVNVSKIIKHRLGKSRLMENNSQAYHNKSEYGGKSVKRTVRKR